MTTPTATTTEPVEYILGSAIDALRAIDRNRFQATDLRMKARIFARVLEDLIRLAGKWEDVEDQPKVLWDGSFEENR